MVIMIEVNEVWACYHNSDKDAKLKKTVNNRSTRIWEGLKDQFNVEIPLLLRNLQDIMFRIRGCICLK